MWDVVITFVVFSDDLTLQIAEYIRENPWFWKLGSVALCIGVIASIIFRLNAGEDVKSKKAVKKDKTEKTDKVKKAKWCLWQSSVDI